MKKDDVLLLAVSVIAIIGIFFLIYKKTGLTPAAQTAVKKLQTQIATNPLHDLSTALQALPEAIKKIVSLAGGGAAATEAATVAGNTTAAETIAAGGTAEEAATAGAASAAEAAGVSGLVGGAIGIGVIALILAIAWAWGVFDPYDPHSGFQKFVLNEEGAKFLMNRKAGDTIYIPDAIFDTLATDPGNLESYLFSQRAQVESQQALADLIAKNDAAGTPLSQTVKENLAEQVYGSSDIQKNYESYYI